ncbi:uncharacterized protein LOC110263139 [Arachis ipaensis]|uniref:uncharacterized protein LOC110263139 n=1 Tax=Arachis ipaensis TaxID=130454 RepID=UPI000A2B84AE|nr:uncharacterized protein LOC110263139 [Arachis ipaensis]QHN84761.1 Retrovirus-related Pol polyprotein [Arachis hypogaea]
MWFDTAVDLWCDLKYRFYQEDIFRIAELEEELFAVKQGDFSVTVYFTKFPPLDEPCFQQHLQCDVSTMLDIREANKFPMALPKLNKAAAMLDMLLENSVNYQVQEAEEQANSHSILSTYPNWFSSKF